MVKKIIFVVVVITLALAFVFTYFFFDPTASNLFPKCQFLMLTGYKCLGCGSQRAIHALLNGEFVEAVRFNAIFVISLPIIGLYLYGEFVKRKFPAFYRAINSRMAVYSLLVMYLAWWLLRNVFGW